MVDINEQQDQDQDQQMRDDIDYTDIGIMIGVANQMLMDRAADPAIPTRFVPGPFQHAVANATMSTFSIEIASNDEEDVVYELEYCVYMVLAREGKLASDVHFYLVHEANGVRTYHTSFYHTHVFENEHLI